MRAQTIIQTPEMKSIHLYLVNDIYFKKKSHFVTIIGITSYSTFKCQKYCNDVMIGDEIRLKIHWFSPAQSGGGVFGSLWWLWRMRDCSASFASRLRKELLNGCFSHFHKTLHLTTRATSLTRRVQRTVLVCVGK